jgi:hypothetical protein
MLTWLDVTVYANYLGIPLALIAAYFVSKVGKRFGGVVGNLLFAFSVVLLIDAFRAIILSLGSAKVIDNDLANGVGRILRLVAAVIALIYALVAEKDFPATVPGKKTVK